jgi:transposase, IS5 family
LKGQTGHAIRAVLCVVGYKIKWLMRMILQKGIKPFLYLFIARALRAFCERLKKIAAQLQNNLINLQTNPA